MASTIKHFFISIRRSGALLKHLLPVTLLLLLGSLYTVNTYAADESYIQSMSGKIKKGDSCMVVDDKFEHLSLADWNQINNLSVDNIISFELRRDTAIHFYNRSFACTLNVTIKYFSSRDQQNPTEIKDVKLVVKYDTASGSYYPVDASYRFKNAYRVTVVVNSITSKELGKKIPDIFRIRNQIFIKRKYPFVQDGGGKLRLQLQESQPQAPGKPASMMRVAATLDPADQKLDITWDPLDFPGAEEYDLEWTYIDGLGYEGGMIKDNYGGTTGPYTIPTGTIEEWMRFNSTRVTVTSPAYSINLPYTEGYILVRIRKVSYDYPSGLRLTDGWVYQDDDDHIACTYITHHNENLNWQYTGAFAEQGRRKEVITYFDATMRNREMVTISNTEDKAIVAETVYDIMGRATMDILPAPIDDNKLQFYAAVNKNSSGNAYSHDDIDLPDDQNCNIIAQEMSNLGGASQYYSANNPFINNPSYYFTKYVPDAEGYPFSVTEYTADNTGRIRRQGSVGQTFQPGSGHETRYYYAKPSQRDLDRLFGVEAGNASHYLKNVVVDPNGQISVSYIDPNGRTVATALAGVAPGNVDQLSSATASGARTTVNQSLVKAADFRVDAGALLKQSAATFMAVVTGDYTVHYSIDPAALLTTPAAGPAFCSNCYYDIIVDVKDDCGDLVATKSSTPFTGNDITCHEDPVTVTDDLSFTASKIGEYTVTYTLKLSEEQIKYQVDQYVANNTDLKTLQLFLHDELLTADLQACYAECSTCEAKLGTLSDFTAKMNDLLLELKNEKYEGFTFDPASTVITGWINSTYTTLYNNCAAMAYTCQPVMSPCEIKLEQMKADVRPGGQYALFDPGTYGIPASESNVSILSYNKGVAQSYKSDPQITDYEFTGENGVVRHIKDGDVTVADFFKAYMQHPEWADDFVKRHIEYCSYQWCSGTASSSYMFDAKLREQVTTGEQAQTAGYFSRSNFKAILDAGKDPFFATGGPGASYKASMQDDLLNASGVLQVVIKDANDVAQPGKSILGLIDWLLYCKPVDPNATQTDWVSSWNSCTVSSGCRSLTREWELYRDYYLQLKSKYVQLAKEAALPNCKSCFIGEPLPASGSCSLGGCPARSEFEEYDIDTHFNTLFDRSYDTYIVHKVNNTEAPVTRSTKVKIRRFKKLDRPFVGVWSGRCYEFDLTEWVEFLPGQSRIYIDNFYIIPWVEHCQEIEDEDPYFNAESTHKIYEMQLLSDSPQCTPLPASPSCTGDPLYAAYQNKQKVFNEYAGEALALNCAVANGAPVTETQSVDALRAQAILDLASLKESWEYKLKSVRDEENALDVAGGVTERFAGISNANITTLAGHLYEIAKKHIETADVYNIRPASTLPTGVTSSHGHNNFTEAFTAVTGSTLMEKGFGPDLLEQPYPYDRTPFQANVPVGDMINTSVCSAITALRPSGYTDQQFHTWLQQELKDDYKLSLAELQDLVSRCGNSCRVLDQPLLLPVAFMTTTTGGEPHPYEGCSVVSGLTDDFEALYPNVAADTKLYRVLFTNYLNKRLGYALSYDEYAAFINTDCTGDPTARLYNKPASPLLQPDDFACAADIISSAFDRAGQHYEKYIEEVKRDFRNAYISKCLSNQATAHLEGEQYEYHYTLYYYDQAGNLVKTIAPEGVRLVPDLLLSLVERHRNNTACVDENKGSLQINNNNQTSGTNYYLSSVSNTFTVEFWAKPTETLAPATESTSGSAGTLGQKFAVYPADISAPNAGMGISVGTNGVGVFEHSATYMPALLSWTGTLNGWTHIAVVYQNKQPRLYINGQLVRTGLTSVRDDIYPSYNFTGNVYGAMPGNIDEVRIWNVARTQQQIADNMNISVLPASSGLAGYWSMSTTDGASARDLTSGAHHATLVNTNWSWGSAVSPATGQTININTCFRVPTHQMPTLYYYNSLNQVVKQSSPDGGTSEFWYDRLGRLAVSQNEEQKSPVVVDTENPAGRFSYTKYDATGRITEVGEKLSAGSVTESDARNQTWLNTWLASGSNRQVTVTQYDEEPAWVPSSLTGTLFNLRKRVAATALLSAGSNPAANRQAATYYSYDISGNVKTLTQENAALAAREAGYVTGSTGLKEIRYEYDLVSGKVNKVLYQDGKWDQFYYQYLYDADDRVVKALSSRTNDGDPNLWVTEATYHYYLHGPLARVELGKNKVQGMDYAYTLQGWLKGVNGQFLNPDRDMSKDGKAGEPFANHARDVLAFSLSYYDNDYEAVGGINANSFILSYQQPSGGNIGFELFNGNIRNITHASAFIDNGTTFGKSHKYDQLNRVTRIGNSEHLDPQSNLWGSATTGKYSENFEYDADGNIKSVYRRNAVTNNSLMDLLVYYYNRNIGGGRPNNNRLSYVTDYVEDNFAPDDLDNQTIDNYTYDKTGNLIGDVSESISRVNWTVYGKIASVTKSGNTMSYGYDATGNRITRKVSTTKEDYYVRDAQGNVLALYAYDNSSFTWAEQDLYGSSRLGMVTPGLTIQSSAPLANANYNPTGDPITNGTEGKRIYELTNHLGNVMVTISDRKTGVDENSDGVIDYYKAEVLTAQDYYAYGMLMPGRTYSNAGAKYKYGFNGKENDNEVKGEGNQQDYGMRIYDPRLGRFLSMDPLAKKFPGESSYIFAGNSPTALNDFDGLFKISPYFIKKYPTLARLLSEYIPMLKDNPKLRDAWIETVGFDNHADGVNAFNKMVTYGEGPWITPGLDEKRDGFTTAGSADFYEIGSNAGVFSHLYPDNVGISSFNLSELEASVKQGNEEDISKQMFIVSVLIMHESSHWGRYRYQGKTNQDYYYEDGAMWEENTFGIRFSYRHPGIASQRLQALDIKVAHNYYEKTLKSDDKVRLFGLSINPNYGYKTWNSVKNRKLPEGHLGDPVLKDNGIREKPFTPSNTKNSGGGSNNGTYTY